MDEVKEAVNYAWVRAAGCISEPALQPSDGLEALVDRRKRTVRGQIFDVHVA